MENNRAILMVLAFLLCGVNINVLVSCEYHYEDLNGFQQKEKVTHLHFYLFDILSGNKPSAVEIAHPNIPVGEKSATPFGYVYAIDDPLREGPDEKSEVVGNAEGLYLSSSQGDKLTLVMYVDFGFTTGKYNGSSISVFSRNPVTETHRELAVVGGRGKFRMARGFAQVRTHYLNTTTGDAILEYNVTLLHY
ncbi:dirigent protein 4-like [Gastrolobium bilobum]|uniref:dirigent protein 4-like n=1 Tax=Gastrolobium bilobum TaxID=150636 RepID=UPI002AB01814|nr:dirigent protein 4-like [Gastrolobium bilobum]